MRSQDVCVTVCDPGPWPKRNERCFQPRPGRNHLDMSRAWLPNVYLTADDLLVRDEEGALADLAVLPIALAEEIGGGSTPISDALSGVLFLPSGHPIG